MPAWDVGCGRQLLLLHGQPPPSPAIWLASPGPPSSPLPSSKNPTSPPPVPTTPQGPILYILTLGVLAPYRGHGLGARLLHTVLSLVSQELPEVGQAQLHVQVGNAAALDLYTRAGFVGQGVVPMYYPRLAVKDAVFLTKELR